jgi:hypothetical protein
VSGGHLGGTAPRVELGTMEGGEATDSTPLSSPTDGLGNWVRFIKLAYFDDPWLSIRQNKQKVSFVDGY